MFSTLAGAALAGLVGSPHCVGMCGGLGTAAGGRPAQTLAWSLGRLCTYMALGAMAGATAGALPLPRELGLVLAGLLLLWFAANLAALPVPKLPVPAPLHRAGAALLRRSDLPSRFLFGLVNGLLPCGLVYAALSLPVALAEPGAGALAMLAFGLGTSPGLVLAVHGLRRLVAGSLWRRRVLALLVLGIGLSTLAQRGQNPSALSPADPPGPVAGQEAAR